MEKFAFCITNPIPQQKENLHWLEFIYIIVQERIKICIYTHTHPYLMEKEKTIKYCSATSGSDPTLPFSRLFPVSHVTISVSGLQVQIYN